MVNYRTGVEFRTKGRVDSRVYRIDGLQHVLLTRCCCPPLKFERPPGLGNTLVVGMSAEVLDGVFDIINLDLSPQQIARLVRTSYPAGRPTEADKTGVHNLGSLNVRRCLNCIEMNGPFRTYINLC